MALLPPPLPSESATLYNSAASFSSSQGGLPHDRDHLDVDHDTSRIAGEDDNMVFGIGIIFVLEPPPSEMLSIPGVGESACVIQQIVTGGTADRHGLLQKGDVILSVGQKSASHLTKEAIGNFLRGPSGSTVRLEWAKPDGRTGELELARGNAGYWSLKDENDRLKLELRDQVDKTLRQGLYFEQQVKALTAEIGEKEKERVDALERARQSEQWAAEKESEATHAMKRVLTEQARAAALQQELEGLRLSHMNNIEALKASHATQMATLTEALQKSLDEVVQKEAERLQKETEQLECVQAANALKVQLDAADLARRSAEEREGRAQDLYMTEVSERKRSEMDALALLEATRAEARNADKKAAAAASAADAAETKAARCMAQVEELLAELSAVRQQAEAADTARYESEARGREADGRREQAVQECARLEAQLASAIADISRLEEKAAADAQRYKELEDEHRRLQAAAVRHSADALAKAAAEQDLAECRAELTSLRSKLAAADAQLLAAPAVLEAARAETATGREEVLAVREKMRQAQRECAAACADLDLVKAQHAALREQVEDLERQLLDSEGQARKLKADIETFREMLANADADKAVVAQREREAWAEVERWRAASAAAERISEAAQADASRLAQEASAAGASLREGKAEAAAVAVKLAAAQALAQRVQPLEEMYAREVAAAHALRDAKVAVEAENSRLMAADARLRAQVAESEEAVETVKGQMNQLRLAHSSKLAAMARRIDDDVHFVVQERDQLQAELDRYYKLPNPVGVGMALEETTSKLDTGRTHRMIRVTDLVPAMAAALSGAVRVGDVLVAIDGQGTDTMDLEGVRERVVGPRGSCVVFKFVRGAAGVPVLDGSGAGVEFSVLLKRGAWGPEHAMVSPEDRDLQDLHRWPQPGALSAPSFERCAVFATTAKGSSRSQDPQMQASKADLGLVVQSV